MHYRACTVLLQSLFSKFVRKEMLMLLKWFSILTLSVEWSEDNLSGMRLE